MNLKQRSIQSYVYNMLASSFQTFIFLVRSILLARMLSPDEFGVYTFAFSFVIITKTVPLFGLGGALLHKSAESEGEYAYRVHFTLVTLFTFAWAILIALSGYFFTSPINHWPIWIILTTQVVNNLTFTGYTILNKKVLFKRIALINISIAFIGTIAALMLAYKGCGVWSIISTDIVASIIPIFGYYIFKPVWKPNFGWSAKHVSYYLNFGKKMFLAGFLQDILDHVDDLWTGRFLGNKQLGFYSRAYTFATYPRRILAHPITAVSAGTFAELKEQRQKMSQAFYRVNSFLIRINCLFSGWLALIAPEFIRILLGDRWLPMLTAFRLMLIYTLLDPLKGTVSNVFIASGTPEKTVRVRFIQLIILIFGLILFGNAWGISGVALAVDLMLVIGVILLYWQAREHVDFSLTKLFAVPLVSISLGLLLARLAILIPGILGSPWRTGAVKTIVFVSIYCSLILILDREQIPMLLNLFHEFFPIRDLRKE
jgi:O-antigen/teichoic acid export membrane protein